MASKSLNYFIQERKATMGPLAGKTVLQAYPTDRDRIDFRELCEEVARNTTFAAEEVAAVLNLTTKIAKLHVENGESVELGDLGTLMPYFRSLMVEKTEDAKFNPQTHIKDPVVKLIPSRKYFELRDVSFEQVPADTRKRKRKSSDKATPPSSQGGGSTPGGSGSGFDGH